MAFTASDVKNLRERTGCGMMDCKKALTESNGDFEKAIEYLREKGLAAATKKAGRIAAEGMVFATVDKDAKVGVVIEVNSETDFVAKNEQFKTFVADLAKIVADTNPATVEELLTKTMADGNTVEAGLQEKILVIGENIKIRADEISFGNGISFGGNALSTVFPKDIFNVSVGLFSFDYIRNNGRSGGHFAGAFSVKKNLAGGFGFNEHGVENVVYRCKRRIVFNESGRNFCIDFSIGKAFCPCKKFY